jgi:hypothetical protein
VKKRRKKLVASKGNKEGKLAKKVGKKSWQKVLAKKSWQKECTYQCGGIGCGERLQMAPGNHTGLVICTQEKVGKH